MFQTLEEKQDELNVNSFGLSLTPLEEIFLKIASESSTIDSSDTALDLELVPTELLHGIMLHVNQFRAMFQKRYLC